jgi:peptidoglycan/LPS O-acetylase OafA/YrhL
VTSPPRSASLRHIPALDGIRGLAILGILLFHAGHLRGGWLGVDLFFVLSGFLITTLLLGEFERTGGISLARFWERRARRLIPALLLFLLGVAAYASLWASAEELASIRRDAFATLLYVANWNAIFQQYDYWDLFTAASPLEHCWSLAIEEQFYLLWPPLVWLALGVFAGSRRRFGLASLGLAGASALWMGLLFVPGESTARVYFGTDTRCFALLVGASLAALLPTRPDPSAASARRSGVDALGLAALAFMGWAWTTLDGQAPMVYRGVLFLLAIAAAAVLAAAILAPRGLTARVFELGPLRQLGVISYGVYLWHWPLYIVLDPQRTGLDGWTLTGLRILVTLAAAWASYVALERRIRDGWPTGSRALGAVFASSGLVVIALFAATAHEPPHAIPEIEAAERRVDELLVGDSVAIALRAPFGDEALARGRTARVVAQAGCTQLRSDWLLLPGKQEPERIPGCQRFQRRWRARAAKDPPGRVLFLDGWPGGGLRDIEGEWRSTCDAEFSRVYRRDLVETIRFLRQQEIEAVVLTIPAPLAQDLRGNFLAVMRRSRKGADTELRRSAECQNRARLEAAREEGIPVIDMAAWICPDSGCIREIDGVVLRPDGVHFDDESAPIVARWLLDELDRLP